MKIFIKNIIIIIFLLLSVGIYAQKGAIKDEGDLIKKANQLFDDEEYLKAFSMYQTLLSNHKDDPEYNFKYAVCLMYADRSDKTKPIFYLEKAADYPEVDKKLYYFLGRAYQMNYQFPDAIKFYEKFRQTGKSSLVEKYDINRRIEECNNGMMLLSAVRGIYVINNVEVKESSFYRSYETKKSGGSIIILPEELKTKYDIKKIAPLTAFYMSESRVIYFASYGEKNVTGLDIYRASQNPDGSWTKPDKLSDVINTKYDDAYPFVSTSGQTIYFSSKGHNSMGEYDIFRSTFNMASFSWTTPENMSFPLNTPFDEILFIPDTNNIYAYFSSNRNSATGLIEVYRIGLNKRPDQTLDFASSYKNDLEIKTAINKVKAMADLKANIQWDKYENSIHESGDFLHANKSVAANAALNIDEAKTESTLSKEEIVDSVFTVYQVLKQKEEDLWNRRNIIGKLNKNTNQQIVKAKEDGLDEGSLQYRQLSENKKLGEAISKQIDSQIQKTSKAAESVISCTGKMQKYAIDANYDSLIIGLDNVLRVYAKIDTMKDAGSELLGVEEARIQKIRDKSSLYYQQSKNIDNEISSLTKERNEYAEAARNSTDEIEKNEYRDLVTSLDAALIQKQNQKAEAISNWKSSRNLADSLVDNLASTDELINEYVAEAKGINYRTGKGINSQKIDAINESIASIRNDLNKTFGELSKAQNPIDTGNNLQNAIETPDTASAANQVIAQNNISTENNNSENNQQNASETPDTASAANQVIAQNNISTENNNSENNQQNASETPDTAFASNQVIAPDFEVVQKTIAQSYQKAENKIVDFQNISNEQSIIPKYLNSQANQKFQLTNDLLQKIDTLSQEYYNEQNIDNRIVILDSINYLKQELAKTNVEIKAIIELSEQIKEKNQSNIATINNYKTSLENLKADSTMNDTLLVQKKIIALESQLPVFESIYDFQNTINDNEAERLNNDIAVLIEKRRDIQDQILALDSETATEANLIKSDSLNKLLNNLNKRQANSLAQISKYEVQEQLISSLHQNNNLTGIQDINTSAIDLDKISQSIENKSYEELFALENTPNVNSVIQENSNDNMGSENILKVPKYATANQNAAALEYIAPVVEKAQMIDDVQQINNQKSIVAYSALNIYQDEADKKKDDAEKLLKTFNSDMSPDEVQNIIDKVKILESEEMKLRIKAATSAQLVKNIINQTSQNNDVTKYLKSRYALIDSSIQNENYALAEKLSKEIETIKISSGSMNDELGTLKQRLLQNNDSINKTISNQVKVVSKLESKISKMELEKEINESNAYLTDNEKQKAKLYTQSENIDKKIDELNAELSDKSNEIRPMQMAISENNLMISIMDELAQEINIAQQDTSKIAYAFNISNIKEGNIKASGFSVNNQKLDSLIQSNVKTYKSNNYTSSIDLVYFQEADIVEIKKLLIDREIQLVNKNIDVLRLQRSNTNDIAKINNLTSQIEELEYNAEDLHELSDGLEEESQQLSNRGQTIVFNSEMPVNKVTDRLNNQAIEKQIVSDSLRQLASIQSRKQRKAMELRAKVLDKQSKDLINSSADIYALENKNKYLEKSATLTLLMSQNAENQSAQSNQAAQLNEDAQRNFLLAQENRAAVKNPKLSDAEKQALLKEAGNLELLALNQQSDALKIYKNISRQDSIVLANRSREEIPTDNQANSNITVNSENLNLVENTDNDIVEPNETQNNIIQQPDRPERELTIDMIEKVDPIQLMSINEYNLSPEVRREVQLRKSSLIGIYIDLNTATQESYYTNNKPIEIQQELPTGLIYKIQIAAFKKVVAPESFKGLNPISIEQRPYSDWYRYLAGNFTNYDDAIISRNQIRQIGYQDAFIVPYFNGERITVARARELIRNGEAYTDGQIAQIAKPLNMTIYSSMVQNNQNQQYKVESGTTVSAIPSGDFTTPELFFAVQIGVFGQPRTNDRLLNLTGTYFDRTTNGYYRYFNGKYSDLASANQAQSSIRTLGIKDAFIVAFYNGQKIPVGRARTILQNQSADLLVQPAQTNNLNTKITPQTQENPLTTVSDDAPITNPKSSTEVNQNITEGQQTSQNQAIIKPVVKYKVQLGAYRNNIPVEVVNSMLQLSVAIEKTLRNDGITVYMTGNFDNYEDARKLKDTIVQHGIGEAFVVAFINGERKEISEAIQVNGK